MRIPNKSFKAIAGPPLRPLGDLQAALHRAVAIHELHMNRPAVELTRIVASRSHGHVRLLSLLSGDRPVESDSLKTFGLSTRKSCFNKRLHEAAVSRKGRPNSVISRLHPDNVAALSPATALGRARRR
jgi:hypothetical protein